MLQLQLLSPTIAAAPRAVVQASARAIQAGCTNGDPFCAKLAQYAGWVPNWLQYAAILGIGLALVMAIIGHHRGWDHMREVITGVIVASVLIGAAGALF